MFPMVRTLFFWVLACGFCLSTTSLKAGLIHHYEFTTDAMDSVGSQHGQFFNGARVAGGVLVLDGVDDFVQFSSLLVPTSGSYSVALFAKADEIPVRFFELISQGYSAGPGFYIGLHQNGNVRVTDSWWPSVPFPADAREHHFALTVNS